MPLESFTSVDGSGRPQLDADEQVSFTADNTSLFLRGDKSEGAGTLFVTTKHLIWMALDRSAGYRMDYPYVLLHAVSRDTSSFPHPCLYAQLDDEVAEEAFATASMRQQAPAQDGEEDEDEDDEEEEPQPISELRFVPENAGILDALYKAVSECAALHPDSDLSEGEGDFMYNADEMRANAMLAGEGEEEDDDGQGYYGEGGDDGALEYGMRDGSSNEARLASLAMRTGLSAEEMFADDADAEADAEAEAEADDGAEGDVDDEERFAKGKPDDGQAQLESAKQQVEAAAAAAVGSGQKREREPDAENKQ